MQKIKTAILISGRGSNMKALIEASKNPEFLAQIEIIISNKKDAVGLEFAQQNGIKTFVVDHKNFSSREEFDRKMAQIIDENNCQIICLAGFMRLLSAWFTQYYQGRMINIHPSLLPNFKGAHAVKDALEAGAIESGCTTHYVCEEMDAGEVIMQARVPVLKDDSVDTLAARILQQEHVIYPKSLEILCNKLLKK